MIKTAPDYKDIVDHLYDGVYFVDRDRVITYWNKGAERITGYRAEDVVGRSCRDNLLNHVTAAGEMLCTGDCPLVGCMADGEVREADVFLHHAEGHRLPVLVRCAALRDDDGEIVGAVESFSGDTGLIGTRLELRQLRRSVETDALTEVANRAQLERRLRALVAEFAGLPPQAAVMMLDVDHFKGVNDTYGHEAGDRVLRMVATTLRRSVRATDVAGRWGGEEFLVLLRDVRTAEDATRIGEKVRTLIANSRLDTPGGSISVTASIGAVLLLSDDTPETVVRRADAAMYRSKHEGRDRVTFA